MFRTYHKLIKFNYKCTCLRHFAESSSSQLVGHKKDTNGGELGRAYDPISVEEGWYDWWQSQGHFSSRSRGSSEVFTLLLPPPNVTGILHLGHALTCSVQDVLARWHRMQGSSVCWLPGMDHAGIATQAVVERHLAALNQRGLTSDKYLEEAHKWTRDKGSVIRNQMRQLGASLDWSKEYFTLDKHQNTAVKEAFVRLHSQGLVYRAEALVNWSCALRSAIAEVEVNWQELSGATNLQVPGHDKPVTFGVLTNVALPLADQTGDSGEIIVATTRVETMLGDVAVAVNPEDPRYSTLIGQHVAHPFRNGVHIPIIADNSVDPLFGTGAVKITPAHDTTDFEIGERHGLSCLTVFAEDGTIAPQCAPFFAGLGRFKARELMTERLGQMGLLRGETVLASAKVPVCSRSGDIVELMLKPQWFIRCDEMAKQAMDAVTRGELVIEPPAFNKVWFDWLQNIRYYMDMRHGILGRLSDLPVGASHMMMPGAHAGGLPPEAGSFRGPGQPEPVLASHPNQFSWHSGELHMLLGGQAGGGATVPMDTGGRGNHQPGGVANKDTSQDTVEVMSTDSSSSSSSDSQ